MKQGNEELMQRSKEVFMETYARFPAVMVEGSGCTLKDADGREYLDFLSGIAVCSLGHCHAAVVRAIAEQAGRLVHVSNLYHTVPQTELAELLVRHSFAERVFLANSGAEVNEAAIKLARKHGGPGRYEIISLEGSFHGRTLAALAATGQPKFHAGFEPMPEGFRHAPFGDLDALAAMIGPTTCAVLCEPLQGESGVRPHPPGYLEGLRRLCDERDLLLIFDEVQTGMGRTGTLFAYEQLGVTPDILTAAKALGNGMPIGAVLTSARVAAAFTPGTHASTFGGNPVAAAAAVATLSIMTADGFLENVRTKAEYFAGRLADVAAKHPLLASGVRGLGMLQGLVLTDAGREKGVAMVDAMFRRGFLINFAGGAVLRFVPPLIVETGEIDRLVDGLDAVLAEI